jgi:hypothetical protein
VDQHTKESEAANKERLEGCNGVVALCNGTMPVYIGGGIFSKQIDRHDRNPKKRPSWEHFSWYEVTGSGRDKEIESLPLRILPFYVHLLNEMSGKFSSGVKVEPVSKSPLKDRWPEGGAGKKHRRKSRHGARAT